VVEESKKMIADIDNTNIEVDIDRPEFTTDEERGKWLEFHNWIITSEVPVMVSGIFRTIHKMCLEGTNYMGGGMQYCFWFENREDKEHFIKKYQDVFASDVPERLR